LSTIGHERNHTPTSPFPKPFRATFPKPASYTSLIHLLNQPPKPASYTSAKQVSETGQRNNREMAPGRGTAGKAGKAGKAAARTACIRDSAGVRGCAGTACASDEKWREKGQQQQEQTHEMAPEPPVGDPARICKMKNGHNCSSECLLYLYISLKLLPTCIFYCIL